MRTEGDRASDPIEPGSADDARSATRLTRSRTVVFLVASVLASCACGEKSRDPLVVLIGLDGATPSVINELRAAGKLPNIERLARRGVYGRLQSLSARRVLQPNPRHGFFSPIIWTSIATGQVPEEHGVLDFVLPIHGTSSVWMGSGDESLGARVTLPELVSQSPLTLHLRLHSHEEVGDQDVRLLLNGESIGTIRVFQDWADLEIALPARALRPAENQLTFLYSRRSPGRATDPRTLSVELAAIRVTDARWRDILKLDPVLDRFSFGSGFYPPGAQTTEVQSVHWRAKPLWMLLGDLPVGVIGYWGTWPAYPVNGFLVSSRMGVREQRQGSTRLTWPPELAERIEALSPSAEELGVMFDRLHVSGCEPRFVDQHSVLKKILVQDEYYARLTEALFPAVTRGFESVYFRSIDVSGHVALHFRNGAMIPEGCPSSLRDVTDEVYAQIDAWIGRVLDALPRPATVVIVSDHGMAPANDALGTHASSGVFIAAGEGIRRAATLRGATALDVAPTLLYLLGAPIPLSMDGKLLVQMFESRILEERPPLYRNIDTSSAPGETPQAEASRDNLEELRSLGYIQ